ncbi:hypothetical protein DRJ48_04445, partial [Candidatus Woesearchaeota archaeon]
MKLVTDEATRKFVPEALTIDELDTDEECFEVVLTRKNHAILAALKSKLNSKTSLALSYFNLLEKTFERLEPHFFQEIATGVHNFINYCESIGVTLLSSSLNPYNIVELFDGTQRVTTNPKRVFVELTRNCNSCCRMCLRRANNKKYQVYNPKHNMKFELFKEIADTLFEHAEFVDLRGFGESTIMPEFERYLDYALRFKTEFGLVTNLSVQNDALWKKMLANGFYLDISIDGATRQTYEYIRRGLKWEHIMHNIKLLVSNTKHPDRINFLFTVQKYNAHEIPEIVGLAAKLGIKNVKLSAVSPQPLFEEIFQRHTQKEFEAYLVKAQRLSRLHDINLIFLNRFYVNDKVIPGKVEFKCPRPFEYLYINYDGTFGGCNQQLSAYKFGVFNKDKLFEALNSPGFLALRNSLGKPYQNHLCQWCYKYR